MVEIRLIPTLLVHKGGLYKTKKFKKPNYIGDPINAIKIFNEKEVDELILVDIDASRDNRPPNFDLIEDVASECFMPLCYAGGVSSVDQMKRIFYSGVEKISLSTNFFNNKQLITDAADTFGSQSVLVTIDYKKDLLGRRKVYIKNGKEKINMSPEEALKMAEDHGAGEIVIQSIDHEGMMNSMDIDFLNKMASSTNLPLIASGGVGKIEHIEELFRQTTIKAVSCGSLFVYKGQLNGVLINYPSRMEINKLNKIAHSHG
ncbi:MAG: AglZ/HisF2 family acetamidino modification protein [Flavobacteriales bacterium]|jgi:cyclase|nr:AglZ/HisF2 family acetamidino modification protein [Flavobacteriales bacterium]